MSSPFISSGQLVSLQCSARVRHCLLLLVWVVDWCVSRLVRLTCSRITLTASSPGTLLICYSFAIRNSILPQLPAGRVRLDLDPYVGIGTLGMFPLFLKKTTDVMTPRLSVVFRRLVRLGTFPVCWRQANVVPILKDQPSSCVANYRPISITSVLYNVFECLVSVRLGQFMDHCGVCPTNQFANWKGL